MEDFFLYKVGPFKAIGFWLSMTTGRLNMGKMAFRVRDPAWLIPIMRFTIQINAAPLEKKQLNAAS